MIWKESGADHFGVGEWYVKVSSSSFYKWYSNGEPPSSTCGRMKLDHPLCGPSNYWQTMCTFNDIRF